MMIDMEFTQEHKGQVEKRIVELMIVGLQNKVLTEQDTIDLSEFVLDRIDGVKNQHELILFLKEFSERWEVFKPILFHEEGQMQNKVNDEVADGIELLISHGKLDRALALVKRALKSDPK